MSEPAHVQLRDVTDEDVEVLFEHQLDPEATEMAAFPARDHDAFVMHWRKIRGDETVVTKTIVSGGEVVGNILSWVQDGHHEIGYWIGRRFWGRGIATAAVGDFIKLVVERPLHAWIAEHNLGSIRVLEKCGFTVSSEQPAREPGGTRYVVMELRD